MSKTPAKAKSPKKAAANKAPAKTEPAKTEPSADGETAAKPKRSKVKLALFALLPLVALGGGGYAGWTFFLAPDAAAEAGHGGEGGGHGTDPTKVAALLPDVRAEVSATHSYAIAVIMEPTCGAPPTPALKAASAAEAAADGAMVNESWMAAVRRTRTLNDKNCSYLWKEIEAAEWTVAQGAEPAKAAGHH